MHIHYIYTHNYDYDYIRRQWNKWPGSDSGPLVVIYGAIRSRTLPLQQVLDLVLYKLRIFRPISLLRFWISEGLTRA